MALTDDHIAVLVNAGDDVRGVTCEDSEHTCRFISLEDYYRDMYTCNKTKYDWFEKSGRKINEDILIIADSDWHRLKRKDQIFAHNKYKEIML
jgi:hypothetical protein